VSARRLPCESALEGLGFEPVHPDGCPPELRWYVKPMSWRERLPMVKGYRRLVAVVDLPVVSAERAGALFDEVARLSVAQVMEQAHAATKAKTPWWSIPVQVLVFLVGIVGAVTAGVSLEMENHDWLVVAFRGDRLDQAGRLALRDCAGASEDFTAVSVAALSDRPAFAVAAPRSSTFGAHDAAVARAALADIQRVLSPGITFQRVVSDVD